MKESKVIEVRVHTDVLQPQHRNEGKSKPKAFIPEKWPACVLILDCETTTDQSQALLFGTFLYCRFHGNLYQPVLEGSFYADDLDDGNKSVLVDYCRANNLRPR